MKLCSFLPAFTFAVPPGATAVTGETATSYARVSPPVGKALSTLPLTALTLVLLHQRRKGRTRRAGTLVALLLGRAARQHAWCGPPAVTGDRR
jgi:hypothetical protein